MRDNRWWVINAWLGMLLLMGSMSVWAQTLEERIDRLEQAFAVSENTFKAFWKDGLRLQTLDKEIEIRIGGRIQNDWNFFFPIDDDFENAFGDPEDRIFFRRARVFIQGTLYKHIVFKAEYDFAGGEVEFTDVYVGLTHDNPFVGYLWLGKFKVPFGLEELTSSRFITFQERSLTDAFVIGRELGFRIGNAVLDERVTWSFSITRPTANDSTLEVDGSAGDITLGLRVTGTPWYGNKGRQLAHIGFGYTLRFPVEDMIRFRTRPEARFTFATGDSRLVDTGAIPAKEVHTFGFEGATVFGPLSLQGEFMLAWLKPPDGLAAALKNDIEDAVFYAWYAMASFFLTGEHRPYNLEGGHFDRPKPRRNFLRGGYGAWEIAARVSNIDLDDAGAINGAGNGGRELNLTFGVNWYPNPNTRVTMNYIYGMVDDRVVDGINLDAAAFSLLMMRFQVDF